MPSGKFVYAANATSWIDFTWSGAPFTENFPASYSMSSSATSSRCAASFFAFSRTRRATIAVAAPDVGVERDA